MKLSQARIIAVAAAVVALGAFATVSFAQGEHPKAEHPKAEHPKDGHSAAEQAAEHPSGGAAHAMDPAAMAAMSTASTPGPQHALLAAHAGHWKTEAKMYWMDPKTPLVSTGTADFTMVLGGRVLTGSHRAELMGMPFEGHSMDGYDNVKGTYWSLWFDNMGTGYMLSTGSMSADGKTLTHTGSSWDPMLGKEVQYKLITKIIDANKHVFEMYAIEGKTETKQMEITYTRG